MSIAKRVLALRQADKGTKEFDTWFAHVKTWQTVNEKGEQVQTLPKPPQQPQDGQLKLFD